MANFENLTKLKSKKMPTITKAWEIIEEFNHKFFGWWSTFFPQLNIDDIEECSMSWANKISLIEKDEEFMNNEKAVSYIYYISA